MSGFKSQITGTNSKPPVQIGIDPRGSKTGASTPRVIDYSNPDVLLSQRLALNPDRKPGNIITKSLDLLTRGQYASAAFTDTLLSQGFDNLSLAIGSGVLEFFDPKARLSYEDIIQRFNPEFAKNNPRTTFALGLAGDIILDPTTYIGVGLFGKAKKVGGVALNGVGSKVFGEILESEAKRVALEFGKENGDDLVRKSSALFFRSNEALTVERSANAIMANVLKDAGYAGEKLQQLGLSELVGQKLTQEKGLRLFVGLGSKEVELPIYKIVNPIFEQTGINRVADKIEDVGGFIYDKASSTKLGQIAVKSKTKVDEATEGLKYKVRGLFILDDELKDNFKYFENFLPNIQEGIIRDLIQVPKIKEAKDLDGVTNALLEIDTLQKNTLNVRGFFDNDEMASISESVFNKFNLSNADRVVASQLQQRINDIKFVEYGVDLVKERLLSFDGKANALIKNADDFIRLKQSLIDGSVTDFVASNKEFQDRIFSLETVKEIIGKESIKSLSSDGSVKYGAKVQKFGIQSLKEIKDLTSGRLDSFDEILPFSVGDSLVEKNGVIIGQGLEDDILKITSKLKVLGFSKIDQTAVDATNKIEYVADKSGKFYNQDVLKANDGSIIRILKEKGDTIKVSNFEGRKFGTEMRKDLTKFTIIKSVASPNEGFVQKFVGGKKETVLIDDILDNKNVVDGVQIDPFGSVAESIYRGDELKQAYDELAVLGKDPNVSALLLYTQRAMIAQKKIGTDAFKTGLKLIYGKEKIKELPRQVQDRINYLGEGLYGSGLGESQKFALKVADFVTGVFKKGATIANPSFGVKQIFQNPIQYALKGGINAFKVFDPRALIEGSAIAFSDNTGIGKSIPNYLSNFFYKSSADKAFAAQAMEIISKKNDVAYLEKMVISNPIGQKMTGLQFLDSAYKLGVFRGMIDDLAVVERDVLKEVGAAIGGAVKEPGVMSFAKNILSYWKYPEHIEKFYRMSYFINGFRTGLSLEDSAKLVDETLFNYQGGLTAFERRVIKRLVPFYSFQRNAIPLIISSALTEPGKVATVGKLFGNNGKFFQVWEKLQGGQELTDEERRITPDFILQQPSAFAGTDDKGNLTFQTFNNYTPFEAINLIEFNEKDEFDFNKTMKKIVLASINPYIKMSVEVPTNRYFFNDRVITESAKVGGVGRFLDMTAPDEVKKLMDFERATDPLTGETKFYVNPYLAYATMSFPFVTPLNNYLNLINPEETAKEKAFDLIFGIKTQKYNKQGLQYTDALKTKYEINEMKGKYRQAIKQGRPNEAERRLNELQKFLEFTAAEQAYKSPPKPQGLE